MIVDQIWWVLGIAFSILLAAVLVAVLINGKQGKRRSVDRPAAVVEEPAQVRSPQTREYATVGAHAGPRSNGRATRDVPTAEPSYARCKQTPRDHSRNRGSGPPLTT